MVGESQGNDWIDSFNHAQPALFHSSLGLKCKENTMPDPEFDIKTLKSSSVPLRVVRNVRASLDPGPFWAGAASGPGLEQLRWDQGRGREI